MSPALSLVNDVHCHLIPGVDEGSRTFGESLQMARALERLGVTAVHATPHQFRFGNDRSSDELRHLTGALVEHLRSAGVGLRVVPGAEYLLGERLLDALDRDEDLLTWSRVSEDGAARCVLVELPLRAPVVNVDRIATLFVRRGLEPVMAHPERVAALADDPHRIRAWHEAGWRFQLDLLSLSETYGPVPAALADLFLSQGLYDHVGSDLHRASQLDDLEAAHATLRALLQDLESRP